jgi:hypothetical protein
MKPFCLAAFAAVLVVGCLLAIGGSYQPAAVADQLAPSVCWPTVAAKINELPEDGAEYSATLFVHRDWRSRPDEVAIVSGWQQLFAEVAPGATIRPFIFDDTSPVCTDTFSDHTKTLPVALIQRPDGYVLYKNTGSGILGPTAEDPESKRHHRYVFPWNTEKPAPVVTPAPNVTVDVSKTTVPDKVVPNAEDKKSFPIALVATIVVCAVIGSIVAFRVLVSKSPSVT